jgi:hypothetical protein
MKSAVQRRAASRQKAEFVATFRNLSRSQRRELALDILRDQKVLADLYDHFLIQEAIREDGRSTSWKANRRPRHSASS